MQCAWFKGGFVLECRTHNTAPQETTAVLVLGYSIAEKAYTAYSYGSTGSMSAVSKGQRHGATWTFTWEEPYNGKPASGQLTLTEDSPMKWSSETRLSMEGGPWAVLSKGTCTRAK